MLPEEKRPLVFLMGKSPVFIPKDRSYHVNHMWSMPAGRGLRFGLTGYAVRLLGEIRKFRWAVEPGQTVASKQPIAWVEGSKAVSDIYSPEAGVVREMNLDLCENPSLLNTNFYDQGWLLVLREVTATSLSPEQYLDHLRRVWPVARQILKQQLHGVSEHE